MSFPTYKKVKGFVLPMNIEKLISSSKVTLAVSRESEKRHGGHAMTTCRQARAVC